MYFDRDAQYKHTTSTPTNQALYNAAQDSGHRTATL